MPGLRTPLVLAGVALLCFLNVRVGKLSLIVVSDESDNAKNPILPEREDAIDHSQKNKLVEDLQRQLEETRKAMLQSQQKWDQEKQELEGKLISRVKELEAANLERQSMLRGPAPETADESRKEDSLVDGSKEESPTGEAEETNEGQPETVEEAKEEAPTEKEEETNEEKEKESLIENEKEPAVENEPVPPTVDAKIGESETTVTEGNPEETVEGTAKKEEPTKGEPAETNQEAPAEAKTQNIEEKVVEGEETTKQEQQKPIEQGGNKESEKATKDSPADEETQTLEKVVAKEKEENPSKQDEAAKGKKEEPSDQEGQATQEVAGNEGPEENTNEKPAEVDTQTGEEMPANKEENAKAEVKVEEPPQPTAKEAEDADDDEDEAPIKLDFTAPKYQFKLENLAEGYHPCGTWKCFYPLKATSDYAYVAGTDKQLEGSLRNAYRLANELEMRLQLDHVYPTPPQTIPLTPELKYHLESNQTNNMGKGAQIAFKGENVHVQLVRVMTKKNSYTFENLPRKIAASWESLDSEWLGPLLKRLSTKKSKRKKAVLRNWLHDAQKLREMLTFKKCLWFDLQFFIETRTGHIVHFDLDRCFQNAAKVVGEVRLQSFVAYVTHVLTEWKLPPEIPPSKYNETKIYLEFKLQTKAYQWAQTIQQQRKLSHSYLEGPKRSEEDANLASQSIIALPSPGNTYVFGCDGTSYNNTIPKEWANIDNPTRFRILRNFQLSFGRLLNALSEHKCLYLQLEAAMDPQTGEIRLHHNTFEGCAQGKLVKHQMKVAGWRCYPHLLELEEKVERALLEGVNLI